MVRRSSRIAALPPRSFAGLESSEEKEEEEGPGEEEREEDNEGRVEDVSDDEEDVLEHRPKKGQKKKQRKPKLQWKVLEEDNETFVDFCEIRNPLMDFEDEAIFEATDPPPPFLVPLLSHQKEWLTWALKQEESPFRGGLLADDGGMGKVIQAITLVLAKKPIHRIDVGPCEALPSANSHTAELPATRCTLIICTPLSLSHWKKEISRCTPEGSTKVLVYHGNQTNKTVHDLSSYDFVLTTYQTMFTKFKISHMAMCEMCGKWRFPEDMDDHKKYHCKYGRFRTANREYEEKLTSSKMEERCANLRDGTNDSDGGRGKNLKQKKKAGTQSAQSSPTITREFSLHSIKWERIILDEAHIIRNRCSYTTRAIFALKSSYKWALTGTPLQNNFNKLYSLIYFLQIFPYAYYFCQYCDWNSISIMPEHRCSCPHDYRICWWKRYVTKQINWGDDAKIRAETLVTQKILRSIMLRRTKESRKELCLPTRIVRVRLCVANTTEEEYYKTFYEKCRLHFKRYIQPDRNWLGLPRIARLLTLLQKVLNHPYLVIYSEDPVQRRHRANLANANQVCDICRRTSEDEVVASCGHVFCKNCLQSLAPALGLALCSFCSTPFTIQSAMEENDSNMKKYTGCGTTFKKFKSSIISNRIPLDDFQTSTKIEALREEIRFMVETDGSAKALVFSNFASFLDLIDYFLQKSEINCVKLVEGKTVDARNALMSRFINDPDCRILLSTLEAGGVSLNLTTASYVFLMEPSLSSVAESRACDRVYQIGQWKTVRIVKFVIKNTIDERILELQAKRNQISESALPASLNLEREPTVRELNRFFR